MLRPGIAGSNTAADHITVLDQALHQIPDAHRYGSPILIRSDSAGSSHEFLAHIRSLREHGLHTQFSVGVAITGPIRTAITVTADWVPGFGRFPSRVFAINQAWLQLAMTGIDLLAWTQTLLLDGALATAEPKKLRYRLLHVAAKLSHTARTTTCASPPTGPGPPTS